MSFGTLVYTWLYGFFVFEDEYENKYYCNSKDFTNSDAKRWVIFKKDIEASSIPPHWHAWLHKTVDLPPIDYKHKYTWQKDHEPNMTGTDSAYYPDSHPLSNSKHKNLSKMNMNLGRLKYIYCIVISLAFNVNASESLIGTAAEIKILDKITAKVTTVIISVNESNEVGSLIIKNYACYKKPPEQVPENFVLLKIEDNLQVSNRKIIYQGWMISSSPDTTPLEHPIYEVWLIDCKMESDF